MDRKVLQIGLFSESGPDVEDMVKRVTKFNIENIGNAILLDILPFEEGDPDNGIPQPHYKLRFLFPSKQAQRRFWTT